jgi:uncharacterized protein YqiB (DUF1249 family)
MEINFDTDTRASPTKAHHIIDDMKEQMKNKEYETDVTGVTNVTSVTDNSSKTKNDNRQDKSGETKRNNKLLKGGENSTFTSTFKYFIFGLVLVSIIVLIIFISYKSFKTQNDNLGALLESARKEEAILTGKLKSMEQEKQMYVHKLNQLNNELQMQQSSPYTSTLPMTKNSYDAPDPNNPKEKPKLLKDKEAIKAYMNSKRRTVQDEIDEQQAEEREMLNNMNKKAKQEIQDQTHSEKKDDEDVTIDDEDDTEYVDKVDEIMSIIQPQ